MKFFFLAMILSVAVSADPLMLDFAAAKKLLFEKNRELLLASENVLEAEGKFMDSSSGYLPKLSLYGSYNYMSKIPEIQMSLPVGGTTINRTIQTGSNDNWNFRASLSQTLFDWGRMFLAPEVTGKGLEAAKMEWEQVKAQALLNLNQAFYSVILSKKVMETNEESYKLAEENIKLADSRLKAGAGSSFDSLRAKVRGSNIKPMINKSKNNYELAQQNLKNILALPLSTEISIDGDFKEVDTQSGVFKAEIFETALKKAVLTRVEIKKAKTRKEMTEVSLALTSTFDKPLLAGSFSYNYQNPYFSQLAWVESWNAGLVLSIPIFDGFSNAGKYKQAEAAVRSAELGKAQIESLIELEVKQAVLNLNDANERISSQGESVKQAEAYYKIAETSYNSGVNTNYDVMDAHLSLLTARTAYLQALYDMAVAKAAYLKAIGELK